MNSVIVITCDCDPFAKPKLAQTKLITALIPSNNSLLLLCHFSQGAL